MRQIVTRSALLVALLFSSHFAHAEDFSTRPELLRGTKAKQRLQNQLAAKHGVGRLLLDDDIERAERKGVVVRLTDTTWYYLDSELGEGYDRRDLLYYVRPWVPLRLDELTSGFHRAFGVKLKVTSLVRTQARHAQVQRTTAAAAREIPSAHLTGAAVDISFKGLTPAQIRWLRRESVRMMQNGEAIVFEEISGGNFHFFFLPPPPPPAPSPPLPVFSLAAIVRCMP